MDRPLLGRYTVHEALVVGRPVTAMDAVLSRPVDVVRLPVGQGNAAAALRRVRAAVSQAQGDLPHVLDLAVVAGQPVAVLMSGVGPEQLSALAACAEGKPARGPSATPGIAVRDEAPRRSRTGAAWVWAAAGASIVLAAVLLLPRAGETGAPQSSPGVRPSALPSATSGPSSAPPPADAPSSAAAPSPDEQVVLLLAAVRDDPAAGVAAPRLLSLLRGLDAATGEERQVLARRTDSFAVAESAAGRLAPAHAQRTRTAMAAVLASG